MCIKTYELMKKIAILASGEGTNAERIIRYFRERGTAEVSLVITNKTQAGVVARVGRLGVPVRVILPQGFRDGEAQALLLQEGVDFLVLAGFLLKVPDDILRDYPERIVNIHPALLPDFGGKGMYGMHVHRAVIAAGRHESGITVHWVNEHYDSGDILFQAACPVLPDDTPETLAVRVHRLEYEHYPRVIEELIAGL